MVQQKTKPESQIEDHWNRNITLHLRSTMASSKSAPSSSTTQRLLRELKEYSKNPNEALLHLGPVNDDDLLHWEAVLKGVKGTPYEGELAASHSTTQLLFSTSKPKPTIDPT